MFGWRTLDGIERQVSLCFLISPWRMKYLYNITSNLRCSLSWHKITSSKIFTTDFVLKQKGWYQQESISVWCAPSACQPYVLRWPCYQMSITEGLGPRGSMSHVRVEGAGGRRFHVTCPGGKLEQVTSDCLHWNPMYCNGFEFTL